MSNYRSKKYRQRFEQDEDVGTAHANYMLYFHLVWCVKERYDLITPEVKPKLEEYIRQKADDLDVHILAIGINPEHVHLIISLKPIHYLPEVIQQLKGYSAYQVNQTVDDAFIKWSRGYGIRTVGRKDLQVAIDYVNNQSEHHSLRLRESQGQYGEVPFPEPPF